MRNNTDELKFMSNEDELYELANLINTLSENNTVTLSAVKEIISAGLTNKVLNVVPFEVGIFYSAFGENQHKQKDNIPMFIKESYTIIEVPSFSVRIAYAIPKFNYRFNLYEKGTLYPSLPEKNSENNVAIILTPMWSGYQVYEYVYEPVTQNNEAPGLIPFRYYIDDYREKEKTYWFSYEKRMMGHGMLIFLICPMSIAEKIRIEVYRIDFFPKKLATIIYIGLNLYISYLK